jgi:hypothetical protein
MEVLGVELRQVSNWVQVHGYWVIRTVNLKNEKVYKE